MIASDRIVFLSVPESLRQRFDDGSEVGFQIDPAIPIPAEIPPGEDKLDLERLSWEMIISGMVKVVAADPEGDDADYYRRFVLAVKPGIKAEFTEAAVFKARNGDFIIALEILDAVASLYPGDAATSLNRARVLEDQSASDDAAGRAAAATANAEAAAAEYRRAMSALPPYTDAFFNAAFFFMKRNNFAEAKACFERYAEIGRSPKRRAKAAALAKQIGDRELDDDLFREAYEAIKSGDAEAGLKKIHEFLQLRPDVWNAWFILGWGLRRRERWKEAAEVFNKALDLGAEGVETRNELAICLMETGDLEEARRQLERALTLDGENLKIISNLGVVSLRQGKTAEAAAFFRTVLELDPNDPLAKAWLEKAAPAAGA